MPYSTFKEEIFDSRKISHLNVLLAEDSPLNCKLIAIIFSQNGLKLKTCSNGLEAVEILKKEHFDIVLMDLEMPVMNGYEAAKMIRHDLKNNIPIIAMSAHSIKGEKEKCLLFGMNEYISKPVDENILFSKIIELSKGHADRTVPQIVINEKVCNMNYLVDTTRGNKMMIKNIVTVFLEEIPKELILLGKAIERKNYTDIVDINHKIKSSFSILGVKVLVPVFEELEKEGERKNGLVKIKRLNNLINTVFEQVIEEMNEAID